MWVGQSVGLVSKLQPAAEIVREIVDEADTVLRRLGRASHPPVRETTPPKQIPGWSLGKRKGLAAAASANPLFSMVAGARNAECYTAPGTYWIDLK